MHRNFDAYPVPNMNLNLKTVPDAPQAINRYDAIVVGSGISGGWAAKELTQKGLRVLMLERGRPIEHVTDYAGAMNNPWDNPLRNWISVGTHERQPIQSGVYAYNNETKHLWVDDLDNPYNQVKPYNWFRGNHLGGRSLMWGRQSYRFSPMDFEANARDGFGVDWPVRYKDLAPWYDYVEVFAGISGSLEKLPQLPDGKFLPPMDMYCLEKKAKDAIEKNWSDRRMIIGRTANLSQAQRIHTSVGRASCQFRNKCHWGCPYGGYFSTQSATLPAAKATGRLSVVTDAIVTEVLYDEKKGRASGVRIQDRNTGAVREYYARIVFLNASTLGTTGLLLNSTSSRFPNGFGNDSGVIGKYLMDHHFGVWITGEYDDLKDEYYFGRRANGIYIPRFRNLPGQKPRTDYVRGFGYQGEASRAGWQRGSNLDGFGADLKQQLSEPGQWQMRIGSWAEQLPDEKNTVTLNRQKLDKWGMPTLDINASFGPNEMAMRKDMLASGIEMMEATGMKNVQGVDALDVTPPGSCIHEMGTCRMGRDPKTSVLNGFNQMHAVKNVFVTDGSFMASSACQNPSLTYMAFTARAADYAVTEMKRGNI